MRVKWSTIALCVIFIADLSLYFLHFNTCPTFVPFLSWMSCSVCVHLFCLCPPVLSVSPCSVCVPLSLSNVQLNNRTLITASEITTYSIMYLHMCKYDEIHLCKICDIFDILLHFLTFFSMFFANKYIAQVTGTISIFLKLRKWSNLGTNGDTSSE
jgi:hypothetical protein